MKKETISFANHDHNYDRQIFRNMIYVQPNLKKPLLKRFSKIFTRKQKS